MSCIRPENNIFWKDCLIQKFLKNWKRKPYLLAKKSSYYEQFFSTHEFRYTIQHYILIHNYLKFKPKIFKSGFISKKYKDEK